MRLPVSLTLIAIGAILALAVRLPNHVVNLAVIGVILILTGVIGYLLSPSWAATYRRLTTIETVEKPVEAVKPSEVMPTAVGPGGRPANTATDADADPDSVSYLVRPPTPVPRRTGT